MKNIYTLYDKKAQSFDNKLILSTNDYTVQRDFFNMMADPAAKSLQFVLSPSDFQIYKIGDYEEKDGLIRPDVVLIAEIANLTANAEE